MSEHSLLVNRLLMAQGAIALIDKNLNEALTLARHCDIVSDITESGDQEQGTLELYGEWLSSGEF